MPKRIRKKRRPSRHIRARRKTETHLNRVLDEVQELLSAGQVEEALQLLESKANRLGHFAPFCAALSSTYTLLGRHWEAAVQARLAAELDPREPNYQLQSALAFMQAGYYSFAFRARQRWMRMVPHDSLVAELRQLDDDYRHGSEELRDRYHLRNAKVAEEAGYLLDQGRWAMEQHQWADALRYSRSASELIPGWPPPRNNVSLALYYSGRHAEAIAEAEAVLRDCDPDNLHALANLTQYCLITGHLEAANDYADRLATLPLPDETGDLLKLVLGLAFLDREEEIAHIIEQAQEKMGSLPARLYVHQGIIAANRGRREEALALLRQAERAGEQSALLTTTREALQAGLPGPGYSDRFPHTHFSDLLDRSALEMAARLMQQDEERGWPDRQAWSDLLDQYPQLPLVARRMLYEARDTAPVALALLVTLHTPEAVEIIREFVTGSKGDEQDRVLALQYLQETGAATPDVPIDMWIGGERRQIQAVSQKISEAFVPDYSAEAWEIYEQALDAQRRGRFVEAERLYLAMLKIEPNAKEAYNNLAGIYEQRGEHDRVDECVSKALEIDPLYPFPRTARALQALEAGDIEMAREWLAPLHTKLEWHPLGFVVYQKAMARLAIREENYQAARKHLELAQKLNEDDPQIESLLDQLSLLESLEETRNWWRADADRYRQRRQRAQLPLDPTLDDCFGLLTKGDMTGISRVLELTGISAYKKAELRQYLMARLSDAGFLGYVVATLRDEEKAALQDLLEHDGVMGWQAFADAHDDDLEESPYLEYHAGEMETAMGRLRARGLLFEGTAHDRLIVAIPRELRPLIRQALNQDGT